MSRHRLRFAPSPNGLLHLGHAFSALYTAARARELDGQFLLRIEDIDTARCKRQWIEAAFEDLAWLGLSWPQPVRRQSMHMHEYISVIDRLDRLRLLYPCFCTRAKLASIDGPRDPDGTPVYPGHCRLMTRGERNRLMSAGKPYALRLDMAKAMMAAARDLWFREEGSGPDGENGVVPCNPRMWGDVILARKDIGTSYHIAVVHDDAVQDITHVTRGTDLFHATSVHRLLQSILELPAPVYCHHRLISDVSGRKLSKSARDLSLRELRAAGLSPPEILSMIGLA